MGVSDYRVWWALFVFFAVLSLLVVRHHYGIWRRTRGLLPRLGAAERQVQVRRVRREGWRLIAMAVSLLAMTGVVFALFLGAPPPLQSALRVLAVVGVAGVLLLSVWR